MSYRLRLHPAVAIDLDAIAELLIEYAGLEVAQTKLAEIDAAVQSLTHAPHRGSSRSEIAPGLRAIPVGRRAVIAFVVDEPSRSVLIYAITYGGADWMGRVRRRT